MVKLPRSRKNAFTLIELLVVIAIIGILSALLFPAITGAVLSAKVTKASNNGGQIWKAIYAKNLENEPNNFPPVWPVTDVTGIVDYMPVDDLVPFVANMPSVDYFSWLVGTDILPVNYGFFALPPQIPAKDKTAFTDLTCGWSVVLDGGEQKSSSPFLLSRNVLITKWQLDADPLNVLKGSADYLFGGKRALVINFGGAAKVFDISALKLPVSKEAIAPGWDKTGAEGGISDAPFALSKPDGSIGN
jgi:prepilin-type N-terminal cleavage/methylation domain-containing protein